MKPPLWRLLSIRFAKPLLDLMIVITGVTVAFLLNSWSESKQESKEKWKVLNSLKIELLDLDSIFPSMANYQDRVTARWDSLLQKNALGDFYNYRFIQPQYNYAVIEYALETNGNIVDFNLQRELLQLYRYIKMLEQTEVYMTDLALKYQPEVDNKAIESRNSFLFSKFVVFSKDRAFLLREVSEQARLILEILNNKLGD